MAVDSSLTSKYINPPNREALEISTILFPSSKSLFSHKTPVATQSAEVNISLVKQPAGINMPIPHNQGMKKSAKLMIKPLAILYNNN